MGANLEVEGTIQAPEYRMSTAIENPSNALAMLYLPSSFSSFIVPLEREIILSASATVLIHYQVSMDFTIATNGIVKNGDDLGNNYVTNSGMWAETLPAGTHKFSVRYRQDVCGGSCYGLSTSGQQLRTMHQPGEDGQTRSLQVIVLGGEGA